MHDLATRREGIVTPYRSPVYVSRHDVTIYSPFSADLFRRNVGRAGGAERQMALLAGELARRGHHVALVVNALPDRELDIDSHLTLVERVEHGGTTGPISTLLETARTLRALRVANGRVVVVRAGTPVVGFIALYCLLWRRRLVFSSANNFDFLDRGLEWSRRKWLYEFGVRRADAVVVQSHEQLDLARRAFPGIRRLVRIASFADAPLEVDDRLPPAQFLWVGRLVSYKRPLHYALLASAVPGARFVLIPHLQTKLRAEEQDLLAQLELAAARIPNLEVRDPVPHSALVKELARAVAVVNTSTFEGMPNTFLEAWGQGVPVLTLSCDPDGVIRSQGLGVSAQDSWERFVAGAQELWDNRFERDELGRRTRTHLREVHSTVSVGSQWEALLASLGGFSAKQR
jgi:glycosyltransferase involved in cell wall biosynthesis